MRGLRSTLILLAVLIGLGAYSYFVTSKQPEGGSSSQEKLFGTLESSQVEEITVKGASGEVTALKKVDGVWQMTAPIAVPASQNDAEAIANVLSDLQVVRVVEENPADVKTYALDAPRIEVAFKANGGKTAGKLLVGSKTATGGNLYARRDDQTRVVLIGQYHEGSLNKSTFELRDKAILKLDRTKVDGVDVTFNGKTFEFAKAGGDWRMTKPFAARADYSAVEALVTNVDGTQMKSVVATAATEADLKKFGLDKPQASVSAHLGSARATLLVGGRAEDTSLYVRDGSKPDVYTTDGTIIDNLRKTADDYRKKELFDFRAFNATRVEAIRGGQSVVFERVKGTPDKWRRVSPSAADADTTKVEAFLTGLADVRANSFVEGPTNIGLDTPVMTVVVKFEEGTKEERVSFSKHDAEAFAVRADDPAVAKIDASKIDDALKALDELAK